jgi:hypothetical protein
VRLPLSLTIPPVDGLAGLVVNKLNLKTARPRV